MPGANTVGEASRGTSFHSMTWYLNLDDQEWTRGPDLPLLTPPATDLACSLISKPSRRVVITGGIIVQTDVVYTGQSQTDFDNQVYNDVFGINGNPNNYFYNGRNIELDRSFTCPHDHECTDRYQRTNAVHTLDLDTNSFMAPGKYCFFLAELQSFVFMSLRSLNF